MKNLICRVFGHPYKTVDYYGAPCYHNSCPRCGKPLEDKDIKSKVNNKWIARFPIMVKDKGLGYKVKWVDVKDFKWGGH